MFLIECWDYNSIFSKEKEFQGYYSGKYIAGPSGDRMQFIGYNKLSTDADFEYIKSYISKKIAEKVVRSLQELTQVNGYIDKMEFKIIECSKELEEKLLIAREENKKKKDKEEKVYRLNIERFEQIVDQLKGQSDTALEFNNFWYTCSGTKRLCTIQVSIEDMEFLEGFKNTLKEVAK